MPTLQSANSAFRRRKSTLLPDRLSLQLYLRQLQKQTVVCSIYLALKSAFLQASKQRKRWYNASGGISRGTAGHSCCGLRARCTELPHGVQLRRLVRARRSARSVPVFSPLCASVPPLRHFFHSIVESSPASSAFSTRSGIFPTCSSIDGCEKRT